MSIQVELKPEVEAMLQKRALDRGYDVAGYVERLIEKDVLAAQSFDEILAPIRQGFQESGMSEDELDRYCQLNGKRSCDTTTECGLGLSGTPEVAVMKALF